MADIDLASMSDDELLQLVESARTETIRRETLRTIPSQVAELVVKYQSSLGRADGDAWVQPAESLEAYLDGATVTHKSKVWRSLVASNIWEPGVACWREVPGEGKTVTWVQPLTQFDSFPKGFKVEHEGKIWVSQTDFNVWEPGISQWEEEKSQPDPEEPDPKPTYAEWVQPIGTTGMYSKGDRVTYNSQVWQSIADNNVWAPGVYGWEVYIPTP